MASCPLCSDILLRHIRAGKSYWLCRRCRLEILESSDSKRAGGALPLPAVSVDWSPTLPHEVSHRQSKQQNSIATASITTEI